MRPQSPWTKAFIVYQLMSHAHVGRALDFADSVERYAAELTELGRKLDRFDA